MAERIQSMTKFFAWAFSLQSPDWVKLAAAVSLAVAFFVSIAISAYLLTQGNYLTLIVIWVVIPLALAFREYLKTGSE